MWPRRILMIRACLFYRVLLAHLRNAKPRCWSILTIPTASRQRSGKHFRCHCRSGAIGTTRYSGCSHTTTSNIGLAAFLPSWNVSPALQAGLSKCPLRDCIREGERWWAWAELPRDPLRLGQRSERAPGAGASAPRAHACGLSSTAELFCLPIAHGLHFPNSAFPAAIGP